MTPKPQTAYTFPIDPFPMFTYAKAHLWRALDQWAWRRLRRLGMPTPHLAYQMGWNDRNRTLPTAPLPVPTPVFDDIRRWREADEVVL